MSDYERCTTCGEYDYMSGPMHKARAHKCNPRWLVLDLDNSTGDWAEAAIVYAVDAGEAAEKWASREDCDSAEYSIVGGTPATVRVRPFDDPAADSVLLIVNGEAVPVYTHEAARSIRCSNHQCAHQTDRRSIGDHDIGSRCEVCASAGRRGLWEATVMLPVNPVVNEVEAAAEGLAL